MAAADTARLIASLELQDKFTKTADKALGKVDRIDKRLGAFSGAVNRNLGRAVDATVARGIRFFTDSVQEGLGSLADLESATTKVDAAIAKTGKTGKVTSTQIADWANEIEANVQAAFDDKAITAATGDLIRFGKVTTANIKPAMVVMTDLAAKTGSVESASTLLAKALADPTKAAGRLTRAGLVLTKQQQKQIAAFVKAGKLGSAQKVIIDALASTTGGAAAASVGKYGDAINMMNDASEDAKKALAEGFLPVIERVAGKLSEIVADPKAMQSLRDFGKGIAGAFDKAVTFAEGVNWKAVGDGLGTAAGFAKTLFDAFTSMPPEVQGTLVALAGLNKLSGGAVTGIVGELGKGLVKGVLGMTAGVVNLRAGVVNGGGGLGGAAAAGGGIGKLGKLALAGEAIAGIAAVIATQQEVSAQNSAIASDIHTSLSQGIKTKTPQELITALNGVNQGINDIQANPLNVLVAGSALDQLKGMRSEIAAALGNAGTGQNFATHGGDKWKPDSLAKEINPKITDLQHNAVTAIDATTVAANDSRKATDDAKAAIAQRVGQAGTQTSNAATGAGSRVTSQSIANTGRITGAIYAAQPTVITNVYVSGASVTKSQTVTRRGGRASSRSDDNVNDHR